MEGGKHPPVLLGLKNLWGHPNFLRTGRVKETRESVTPNNQRTLGLGCNEGDNDCLDSI